MHLTCKNNPVKLTGKFGGFEVKDLGKGILSTSLLKAAKGSDAAQSTVIDQY